MSTKLRKIHDKFWKPTQAWELNCDARFSRSSGLVRAPHVRGRMFPAPRRPGYKVPSVLSVPQWASGSKRAVGRASAARPFVPCELTSIHTLLRRETTNLSRGLQVRANEHTTLCPCGRRVPTRRPRARLCADPPSRRLAAQ